MPIAGFKHSEESKRAMSATRLLKRPAERRFWQRVVKTQKCWVWIGDKDKDGYGRLWVRGRSEKAHRFSYKVHVGEVPGNVMVLHSCDNPSCVRPDHLFLGNNRDNVDDMLAKGRSRKGQNHNNAKLTEFQAIMLLQWRREPGGKTLRELANSLGVSLVCAELIRSGRNWKHIYKYHAKFGRKV